MLCFFLFSAAFDCVVPSTHPYSVKFVFFFNICARSLPIRLRVLKFYNYSTASCSIKTIPSTRRYSVKFVLFVNLCARSLPIWPRALKFSNYSTSSCSIKTTSLCFFKDCDHHIQRPLSKTLHHNGCFYCPSSCQSN